MHEHLEKLITDIENGGNNWFTCVLYGNVEPTNNFAEQTIRESVIVRKIIGAFISENGAASCKTCITHHHMETLMIKTSETS